mmetsp:Transcript_24359/g.76613  ORF Transcript_24359/g.76613 Transcript_24359/m.76613 type:complete len:324 (-) Transcript_24359:246-1217(-)
MCASTCSFTRRPPWAPLRTACRRCSCRTSSCSTVPCARSTWGTRRLPFRTSAWHWSSCGSSQRPARRRSTRSCRIASRRAPPRPPRPPLPPAALRLRLPGSRKPRLRGAASATAAGRAPAPPRLRGSSGSVSRRRLHRRRALTASSARFSTTWQSASSPPATTAVRSQRASSSLSARRRWRRWGRRRIASPGSSWVSATWPQAMPGTTWRARPSCALTRTTPPMLMTSSRGMAAGMNPPLALVRTHPGHLPRPGPRRQPAAAAWVARRLPCGSLAARRGRSCRRLPPGARSAMRRPTPFAPCGGTAQCSAPSCRPAACRSGTW